ncbi:MAG: potassium transporter TrkG [Chloroflexota bacterium]
MAHMTKDGNLSNATVVRQPINPLARKNAQTLVIGFALIILVGTVLLRLPIAGTERPLTWSEALFTSTSATTVTGLVVITPARDLSLFGQIVVLLLIQIGGIGFVAFSVLLFALIGRRLGIAERLLLRQSLGVMHTIGIGRLTLSVLFVTSIIQLAGAILLWLRWWPEMGMGRAAYLAIFHSISAFCNAGFDLYSGVDSPLFGFGNDIFTLTVLMGLIILGGLGILVALDLITFPWDNKLLVHTKLTLIISAILIVLGLIVFAFDDFFGTITQATPLERFWIALFSVVSSRTAGLTIVPLNELNEASALTLMISMFIGGAPASMAGGVTISTVGVLIVAVVSTVRGKPQSVVFGRTLPLETIGKAVAVMTVSTLLCFIVTLILLVDRTGAGFEVGFEVISAFSNTGYSLGTTSELDDLGRLLIAFTMFWGRLGPLTLVILIAQQEKPTTALYPSEQIVIG